MHLSNAHLSSDALTSAKEKMSSLANSTSRRVRGSRATAASCAEVISKATAREWRIETSVLQFRHIYLYYLEKCKSDSSLMCSSVMFLPQCLRLW